MSGGGGDSEGERRPLLAQASGSRDTFGRNQQAQRQRTQDSISARNGGANGEEDEGDGPENGNEEEQDEEGMMSWREWMGETLESPRTHKIVLTLIAIDACCVLADLAYEFLSPDDKGCGSDTSSKSSLSLFSNSSLATLRLDGEDDPAWLTVLSHLSLVINALFVLEIPLAIWCFGLEYYMPFSVRTLSHARSSSGSGTDERERDVERGASAAKAKAKAKAKVNDLRSKGKGETHPYAALHLFDALVVLATFVLEVVLRGRERELAGLLVLLRLWRLVKLVGGIAVGAGEIQEELSEEIADKEEQLQNARARIAELEAENARLKAQTHTDVGAEEGGGSAKDDANIDGRQGQ